MNQPPMRKRPSPFLSVRAIGKVAFREVVRDRLFYNVLIVAAFFVGLSYLASRLSYSAPDRLLSSFGLATVTFCSAIIAILLGSASINREFERRTVYVVLAKPITRFEFVLGKFLGIGQVLVLNWLLLSSLLIFILSKTSGWPQPIVLLGLYFSLLQSFCAAAIAIFFSSFVTTSLSIALSLGLYLVGQMISQVQYVAARTKDPLGREVLEWVGRILPDFEVFHLGTKVVYGFPVQFDHLMTGTAYCLALCLLFVILSGMTIHKREV